MSGIIFYVAVENRVVENWILWVMNDFVSLHHKKT